jgi:hypothetical protein
MSVYDPHRGRFGLQRSPSSTYSYSYASSSPYSAYTDDWYSRSLQPGVVSERMYYSLNGKLIRASKIRNYRVRHSCLCPRPSSRWLTRDLESPETGPGLVPGHDARHRLIPYPVLCQPTWTFRRTLRRLQIVHIQACMAVRNRQFGGA